MKLEISKEWCMAAAEREGDNEVGAGALAADPWPQWRHKKRGGTYTEMGRAHLQIDGPLDDTEVVVYQSNADGKMYARPVSEFMDGRFERTR